MQLLRSLSADKLHEWDHEETKAVGLGRVCENLGKALKGLNLRHLDSFSNTVDGVWFEASRVLLNPEAIWLSVKDLYGTDVVEFSHTPDLLELDEVSILKVVPSLHAIAYFDQCIFFLRYSFDVELLAGLPIKISDQMLITKVYKDVARCAEGFSQDEAFLVGSALKVDFTQS